MPDYDLVKDILRQIRDALQKIEWRFAPVTSVSDLTDTPEGMEKLDSICMLLVANLQGTAFGLCQGDPENVGGA